MAAIATAAGNGVGTGVSHSSPATVFVRGVLDGATVGIQVADENVAGSFVNADNVALFSSAEMRSPGATKIEVTGTYFIRAVISGGGPATSVNVVST